MVPSRGATSPRYLAPTMPPAPSMFWMTILGVPSTWRARCLAQATLDVGRPAGCEVDQYGETLARVEGIIRVRHRCGHRESGAKRDDGAHPKHRDPPPRLFCRTLTACSATGKQVLPRERA